MERKGRTFAFAMFLESGLGFVGIAIASLAGINLSDRLMLTQNAFERGLLATLPMLAMLGFAMFSDWSPLVEVRRHVEHMVRELFARSSWIELALVSLAAGLGEELLFRGALQPWIATWTNPRIALAVVSLLFGLAHALSTVYFVLATLIGVYFGWMATEFDDLVAPIVAHAVYDFIALMYFQYRVNRS